MRIWLAPQKCEGRPKAALSSASWRKRIVAVRVLFPDLTVGAVNDDLPGPVTGDLSRRADGLALGIVSRGDTAVAFSAHGPPVVVRYYVLIAPLAHLSLRLIARFR
jgi:hypothetical protein